VPKSTDFEQFWVSEIEDVMFVDISREPEENDLWLPSLSQLLAEIEGRGYEWGICKQKFVSPEYLMELRQLETKWRGWADTPEEAAGKALLWVLERGDING
jgi:hypothetical protein